MLVIEPYYNYFSQNFLITLIFQALCMSLPQDELPAEKIKFMSDFYTLYIE